MSITNIAHFEDLKNIKPTEFLIFFLAIVLSSKVKVFAILKKKYSFCDFLKMKGSVTFSSLIKRISAAHTPPLPG